MPELARPVNPGYNPVLLHNVVTELQDLRDRGEVAPPADTDIVWVLSAPGTYNESPQDLGVDAGVYSSRSFDRLNIDAGIQAVYAITAQRLGVPVEQVTKEDVEAHGPTLYYNGEDEHTEKVMYLQNEALLAAAEDPAFPLPASKLVVDTIPIISTRPQVSGFAAWLRQREERGEPPLRNVAVVSLFGHSARVGRYIQHELNGESFPEGMRFDTVPVYEGGRELALGAAYREARRIILYADMGHLARESVFAAELARSSFSFRPDDIRREFNVDTEGLRGHTIMTVGDRQPDASLRKLARDNRLRPGWVFARGGADDIRRTYDTGYTGGFERIFIDSSSVSYGETEQDEADFFRLITSRAFMTPDSELRICFAYPGELQRLLQLGGRRGGPLSGRRASLGEYFEQHGIVATEEVAEDSLFDVPFADERTGEIKGNVKPRVIVLRKTAAWN